MADLVVLNSFSHLVAVKGGSALRIGRIPVVSFVPIETHLRFGARPPTKLCRSTLPTEGAAFNVLFAAVCVFLL
ncbi:hypothetical protein VB005_03930 [Metarhizium brunneum]